MLNANCFASQKYDEDQKIVLDQYLMESMLCMLVPHTHSLTDQVCKPVRSRRFIFLNFIETKGYRHTAKGVVHNHQVFASSNWNFPFQKFVWIFVVELRLKTKT